MPVKVYLYGSDRYIEMPDPVKQPSAVSHQRKPTKDDAAENHRKASFAAMRRLKPHLRKHGVTETDIWEGIKQKANVKSRSELTARNWAIVSAQLNAALRSQTLLGDLVKRYKQEG